MLSPEAALCSQFYCTICGIREPHSTRAAALEYWASLTDTPWKSSTDPTEAYGERFFQGVQNMEPMKALRARWASAFDDEGVPHPDTDRLAFLKDFLRTLLHSPHNYHSFFYTNPTLASGHPMDWAIEHPIAADFWTVYFSFDGQGTLTTQGQTRALPPETACILPPGCKATLQRDETSAHWSFGSLNFRLQGGWFGLLDWAFSIHQPTVLDCRASAHAAHIRKLLQELASLDYTAGDTSEKLCYNLIECLLIRLRTIYETDSGGAISQAAGLPHDKRVSRAAEYVLNNYDQKFTLESVARTSGLSANRLNELFRQHHGTSVMQWRDRVRLNKARELLLHTDASVAAVAGAVGWEDQFYFSRRFRKMYGSAPGRFRKASAKGFA